MKKTSRRVLEVVMGSTLAASGAVVQATALATTVPDTPATDSVTSADRFQSFDVRTSLVEGRFAFDQDATTPNATISQEIYGSNLYLCGAGITSQNVTAENYIDWEIAVSGDVRNAFTSTVGDLAENGSASTILGCTCGGNQAGGRASVNAGVTGITVSSILELAQPAADVNTITFISDDGYTVSLPLSYVAERYSMIVYEINDEPFCETAAGSANQLWLGSTSARYFTQNVSQIVLTAEKEIPPTPGTPEAGDTYANRPNISVLSASEEA